MKSEKGGASPSWTSKTERRPTRAVSRRFSRGDEDARSYLVIIPGGARFLDPRTGLFLLGRKEESLPTASISEIHRFPLRPEGFLEPLFPTLSSKRTVAEHLFEAPWLMRASELKDGAGEAAHFSEEPVRLEVRRGRAEVVRFCSGRRNSWRRSKVLEVLDRWREVGGWWDEDRHTDRLVFRVLLSGGVVVDLARERFGGWSLVGVVD